ncbi:MAG: hypothetical protein ACFB9M_19455 [Myxococcota bacterium]
MSRPHLRPHFDLVVALKPDEVLSVLKERFRVRKKFWTGHVSGSYIQLKVPRHHRHPWSPWLSFQATEHERGTLLTGRFAPSPNVWTLYMAGYGVLGTLVLGLGFFGLAQWMAGEAPTMLWAVPVCLVLMLAQYGFAFIGQGLTAREMASMREFIRDSFDRRQSQWADPVFRDEEDEDSSVTASTNETRDEMAQRA